jgi:agmatine deiminase
MTRPVDDGFFMPAEWAAHRRCWIAWPRPASYWGEHLEAAQDACAEAARTIAEYEPVTMVVAPDSLAEASLRCGSGVSCLPMAQDDCWMRDTGPSFLVDGKGGIAGVSWRFNGWGGKFPDHADDAEVASQVLEHTGTRRYDAPLVLEGGAIHVDGEGTVLTSEQCLLNPNRNPDLSKPEVEDLLHAYLGAEKVIWLGKGLVGDETDGHVDTLACFAGPGRVLALTSGDPEDANYRVLQDNLERLSRTKDARGRSLEVLTVEQPRARYRDDGTRLATSYINFYIANGAVVVPSYEDPLDQPAFEIIKQSFPDREAVQVPALDLAHGGGAVHCITQQEPDPGTA